VVPPVDAGTVAALLTDDWIGAAAALSEKGAAGALADADVAGLWLAEGRVAEDPLEIIEAATRSHGLPPTIAGEDRFADLLSGA